MTTWTEVSKSNTGTAEVDFLFSDGLDFLFSDGSDYVFKEGSGTTTWTEDIKSSPTWATIVKN